MRALLAAVTHRQFRYGLWVQSSTSSDVFLQTLRLALLALAQVILRRANRGTRRRAVGIEARFGGGDHTAIGAHHQRFEPWVSTLVHPMPPHEFGGDAIDRALDAERLPAADAGERLLLLEHARGSGRGAEIELRLERDHLLRTGRLAQPALHAQVFRKTQRRALGIVGQRVRGTGRHAGEAETAPNGAPAGNKITSTGTGAAR